MPDQKRPDDRRETDFGLGALIEHWRAQRTAAMKAVAQPFQVSVHDPIPVDDQAQIIRAFGIPSEEGFGQTLVNVPEVVIPSAFVVLGDKNAEGRLVVGVGTMWLDIINECRRDPTALLKMSARAFEEFLAGLYERQKFWDEIILTPSSGDKERDVILTVSKRGMGVIRIIDQARRYTPRHRISLEQVRAMAGILYRDRNVSKAIITTTSDFEPGAEREYRDFIPQRLELRNGRHLLQWVSEIGA
jgi:restriction system protein